MIMGISILLLVAFFQVVLFSPLIVVVLITVVFCHCRYRKKRMTTKQYIAQYKPIVMTTEEERKERTKQYMAQARTVVEAAPVAKMV